MNNDLVERFAAGADKVRLAIAGLVRADCIARPGPGAWSIQELVIHLADSDAVAIERMKRVIAEKEPILRAYDENAWIQHHFCNDQSIEDAAILFEVNRRQMARILRRQPAEAFDRFGMHSDYGRVTLGKLLTTYLDHLEHHLKFLREKRERLGKPLK
jgi:hypothetical protein